MSPRCSRCALLFAGAALLACSSGESDSGSSLAVSGDVPAPAVPGAGASSDNSGELADPAPEVEREATFRAPVVTGKYVWSANPESGRVAIIDAESYEIRAAQAGRRPTFIAAVNQSDALPRALVINSGGDDATFLELESGGVIRTQSVPLHQGADSWSVAPGGQFAIAWTDSSKAEAPDPTDGFQDITVVELRAGTAPSATRLTVGYRPSAFAFDGTGRRAFGITEDGISVVELEPGAVRLSQLVPLPSRQRTRPDVSVTPDGTRAVARLEGSSILYDIDLATGQTRELDLGGVLTDLDLSEDGTRAVAVTLPSPSAAPAGDAGASDAGASDAGDADAGAPPEPPAGRAVFIPIPAGLTDPALRQTFTSPEAFRSVALSPDGARAVLFTTSRPSGRVTLVGPALEARSLDLIAPVRAVFLTAEGAHAIALQDAPPGSVKRGAFSVLSLGSVRAPKLVAADAPALAVALPSGSSDRALVTVSDRARQTYGTFLVRTENLQVDFQSLSSEPLASGTVPAAGKGFIAQAHPEGRITFIDLTDGAGREITGFELSSQVVNE